MPTSTSGIPPDSSRDADLHKFRDLAEIYQQVQQTWAQLVGREGSRPLPDSAYAFLVDILATLAKGESVSICPRSTALTTAEAAKILGFSRQFLIGLIERGEINSHMVGVHQRLNIRDVFEYKALRDVNRRKALRELSAAEAAEGLYDRQLDTSTEPESPQVEKGQA